MQHSYHLNVRVSFRFCSCISYPSSELQEEKIGLTFILTWKVGTWIILLSCCSASMTLRGIDFERTLLIAAFVLQSSAFLTTH